MMHSSLSLDTADSYERLHSAFEDPREILMNKTRGSQPGKRSHLLPTL